MLVSARKAFACITTVLFMVLSTPLSAQESFVFSGGAPLSSPIPSIVIPLLSEAFVRNDLSFEAEYNPPIRSLQLVNAGEKDGELHRTAKLDKTAYENLHQIDSKLLSVWETVYAVRKDLNIQSWEDLRDLEIAFARDRELTKRRLAELSMFDNVTEAKSHKEAFMMVAAGRADVAITDNLLGWQTINTYREEFAEISVVGSLEETELYAYIHKKHLALASQLSTTLERMKADGSFQRIVDDVINWL